MRGETSRLHLLQVFVVQLLAQLGVGARTLPVQEKLLILRVVPLVDHIGRRMLRLSRARSRRIDHRLCRIVGDGAVRLQMLIDLRVRLLTLQFVDVDAADFRLAVHVLLPSLGRRLRSMVLAHCCSIVLISDPGDVLQRGHHLCISIV